MEIHLQHASLPLPKVDNSPDCLKVIYLKLVLMLFALKYHTYLFLSSFTH